MANQQFGDGNSSDRAQLGVNGQEVAIASGTGAKLGVFGATPVAQATPAGNTTTVTAGSTTAVYTNTSFSGGVGSTAFTVGDIVAVLKGLGILKI